jgi:hypothetical protein
MLTHVTVRTGFGSPQWDGEFTDEVERIRRVPRQHAGW